MIAVFIAVAVLIPVASVGFGVYVGIYIGRSRCACYTPRHATSDDVPEGAHAKVFTAEIPEDYDPPSASMDPAAVTSPDIRWQVAP